MAELKQQQQDHQSNAIVLLDGGMGHELKLRGVSDSNGTFLAGEHNALPSFLLFLVSSVTNLFDLTKHDFPVINRSSCK